MIDFDIQRCSRRCSVTGRELAAGEACFSAVVAEGGQVVRRDYAAEAWTGPPEGVIGWWKTVVVDPSAGRMHWAPSDVMLNYFERLADDPAGADDRYVMALLLVRRRIARVEANEKNATGENVLVIYCPRNEQTYRVPETSPTPERVAAIQQHLAELLQMNGGDAHKPEAQARASASDHQTDASTHGATA
jgi:hypothetical protein